MRIDLVRAIEEFIRSYPASRAIKNGKAEELFPGQENIEKDVDVHTYVVPLLCERSKISENVKVKFVYDMRTDAGFIKMSEAHLATMLGFQKDENLVVPLYRVRDEILQRAKVDMQCFKCGHVIEHECW